MDNWKLIGGTFVVVIAVVSAMAYAPNTGNIAGALSRNIEPASHAANMSYTPSHQGVVKMRLAQSCIAHGQICTINGTACCNAADSCTGKFPNTTCQ